MNPSDDAPHLTACQLAARWTVSSRTLERWRKIGRGPMYLRWGRWVRYPLSAVITFESAHSIKTGPEHSSRRDNGRARAP